MAPTRLFFTAACPLMGTVWAIGCPYMTGEASERRSVPEGHPSTPLDYRSEQTEDFLKKFYIDSKDADMTSDVGGPFADQNSLRAGARGPALLEDFIFRQKLMHFDHERIPERPVHARGAGAHGVFTSYGDWSNITGASFLKSPGKETPVFIRFSTVAGSRGSADTARDVHGFAVRFYTDEGNFDVVGNNIPVFFIQDAILFPDLIHAVKPQPDREIPQAATAHDNAWDFFSQQPSTLHTLFWAMAQNGIVRSYRHMDGHGVNAYRFVTEDGKSKYVKFHFKTQQGRAGLLWEEAQIVAGKNADYHRQDLWEAIEKGRFPEWEFGVQIVEEKDALRWGFDILDPTKIIPEEYVPITPLGKLTLNRNPRNYFAEVEQVSFQPGHVVRGVDFSEDPLLQGRLYSYMDTQLNRHRGPNFESIPINQPRVPWHNNNRDGSNQMYIPLNNAPYTPNTMNSGSPRQATQSSGRGFFTTPGRTAPNELVRSRSDSFKDVWSQPRLFYNSLLPQEQQFLINAIRFETSKLTSTTVKKNVLIQLNRVSHDIAVRVGAALGLEAPAEDTTYYHDNTTASISVFKNLLPKLDGLKIGILTSVDSSSTTSLSTATALKQKLASLPIDIALVAEITKDGISQSYSATDASDFDAVIVHGSAAALFATQQQQQPHQPQNLTSARTNTNARRKASPMSTLYPAGRPQQILLDAYRWGKPVAVLDGSRDILAALGIPTTHDDSTEGAENVEGAEGVYVGDVEVVAKGIVEGLKRFKFLDRFAVDDE